MKAITVRDVPKKVAQEIRRRARERGASLSRAVVSLLEEATGGAPRPGGPVRHHDLDALAGSWSREEAVEFEDELRRLRAIDPEMWK